MASIRTPLFLRIIFFFYFFLFTTCYSQSQSQVFFFFFFFLFSISFLKSLLEYQKKGLRLNLSVTRKPTRKLKRKRKRKRNIRCKKDEKPELEVVAKAGPRPEEECTSDAPQEIDEYELVDPVDSLTPPVSQSSSPLSLSQGADRSSTIKEELHQKVKLSKEESTFLIAVEVKSLAISSCVLLAIITAFSSSISPLLAFVAAVILSSSLIVSILTCSDRTNAYASHFMLSFTSSQQLVLSSLLQFFLFIQILYLKFDSFSSSPYSAGAGVLPTPT